MSLKERFAEIIGKKRITHVTTMPTRETAKAADSRNLQFPDGEDVRLLETPLLPEDERAHLKRDMEWLGDDDTANLRLQREAEQQMQTAVEDSVKRVHIFNMGRCPNCNERLAQHLFAAICEKCGWKTFERPRNGPVRVHLQGGNMPINGENCYNTLDTLVVLKDNAVIALIPRRSVAWVEYVWSESEMQQRYKQLIAAQEIRCGWCDGPADPEKEGFNLVQLALGTSQERYVFCSDPCYEAFRKMYPSRVHRNCYERNCAECNLCVKRYEDEAEGVRVLAKDFLRRAPVKTG